MLTKIINITLRMFAHNLLLLFAQPTTVITQFIMSITFSLGTIFAANILHTTLLVSVMRLPMTFFDTTPLGRVLNRFSKDQDVLDNVIGHSVRMLFAMTLNVSQPTYVILKNFFFCMWVIL